MFKSLSVAHFYVSKTAAMPALLGARFGLQMQYYILLVASCKDGTTVRCAERAMGTDFMRTRVIIIGAAGRDFHDFNVLFRNNRDYEVVAFTAAQIPYISGRMYPAELAGPLYPKGIQIYDESELGGPYRQAAAQSLHPCLQRPSLCMM